MAEEEETPPADDETEGLVRWLAKGPYEGKPFRDFVPPGQLSAISRLIDDIALNWPWPFKLQGLEELLAILPEPGRDRAAKNLVCVSRKFIGKTWAQMAGPRGKPNPIQELKNLKQALDDALAAFRALSQEGERMLREGARLHVPGAPDTTICKHMLDGFLHEHRLLQDLPEPAKEDRRGIDAHNIDRQHQAALDQIWREAFDGAPPTRGFPDFESAAIEPLRPWLPHLLTGKSRQDLRRPADRSTKRRRNSTKAPI